MFYLCLLELLRGLRDIKEMVERVVKLLEELIDKLAWFVVL